MSHPIDDTDRDGLQPPPETGFPLPLSEAAAAAVREYGSHVWRQALADPDWRWGSTDPEAVRLFKVAADVLVEHEARAVALALRFRGELGITGTATEADAFRLADHIPYIELTRREGCGSLAFRGGKITFGSGDAAERLVYLVGVELLCGPEFDPPTSRPGDDWQAYGRTHEKLGKFADFLGRAFAAAFLEVK